jgi:hypothetical protein
MQKNTCQSATTTKTTMPHKEIHFAVLTNEPVPLPQLTMHIVMVEEMQIKNQNYAQALPTEPTTMQKYASARTTRTRTIVLHKKKHFTILKNKPVPLQKLTMHKFKVKEIQMKTRKSPFKIDKPNYAHRRSNV